MITDYRAKQLALFWKGCACGECSRELLSPNDVADLMEWTRWVIDRVPEQHDSFEPVEEAQAQALIDALGSADTWVGELMDAALAWEGLGT